MIKLPIPPSTNMLYRNAPGHGRFKTKRYMTWLNAAGWELKAQSPQQFKGSISIVISISNSKRTNKDGARSKVKCDISNYIKAVEDLLVKHEIIEDDSLVEVVSIRWADVDRCEVTVIKV